jgi:SAM-dependent methyltransferase
LTHDFGGSVPEFYDRYLGDAYFGPQARALAERVPAQPEGDVLELACGTGRATMHLRKRVDAARRIVATDLSAPMLAYARSKLGDDGIEWREADMGRLPFEDRVFGAVACALGVMFPPDKAAVFAEARRVLRPGAPLAFSVWDSIEANPTPRVIGGVLEALDPALRFRTPYEMGDPDALRKWLREAGFTDIRIEPFDFHIEGIGARDLATGHVRGTPRSALITEKGFSFDDVIDRVARELARSGGDPYRAPARVMLVEAR